jgi:hypothetical protein
MPSQLPILCSLSAAELPKRLAEMSTVGHASLLAAEIEGARAVLRFRDEAAAQLATIVAAEAECCPFLSMKLDDVPAGVRLTIEGPPGTEPVLDELVAAFSSKAQTA